MGRINTYEQQVGIAGGEIDSSVSTQTAGAPGQALAQLGNAVEGLGTQIHKNDIHDDISNSYAGLSALRNKYSQRIQAETQSGNIDVQKIQDDYQDDLNKLTGGVNTHEGANYLQAHGAVLNTDIIKLAAHSKAFVAGKLATEQWNNSTNLNANTLESDPAGFDGTLRDSVSVIEAQVQNGTMDRTTAEEFKRKTGETYARSAVVGWAKINAQTAQDLLDKGTYDKFLDPKAKQGLDSTIRAYKNAETTDKLRLDKLQEDAQKKASEAWEQDHISKLEDGSLAPKDILSSPLKAERKIQYMNMLHTQLTQQTKTDPAVKNYLIQRVLLPEGDKNKITDPTQLYDKIGKGITITDLKQITSLMDKTPEGQIKNNNRRQIIKLAESTLAKKDSITGMLDPQGQLNVSLFSNDLFHAEERMKKEGKDPALLSDPNSKEYYGNQILKYKRSPQEQFQNAMDFKEFKSPIKDDVKMKPGERISDWKKRTGL